MDLFFSIKNKINDNHRDAFPIKNIRPSNIFVLHMSVDKYAVMLYLFI